jgi:hypothetical protein
MFKRRHADLDLGLLGVRCRRLFALGHRDQLCGGLWRKPMGACSLSCMTKVSVFQHKGACHLLMWVNPLAHAALLLELRWRVELRRRLLNLALLEALE